MANGKMKRRLWLLAGLTAAVGIGIVGVVYAPGWFTATGAVDNAVADAKKDENVFRQDFRGRPVNEGFFLYTGPNARQKVRSGPEGVHISVGDGFDKPQPTGLVTRFHVEGDFAITTTYELLRAERTKGASVGATLYLATNSPGKDAVMLARFNRGDGNHYICYHLTTDAKGKRRYNSRPFPTEAVAGKLRMVREGTLVNFLVADADSDEFRHLHQFDFGAEDLVMVRIAADPGSGDPVEVRFADFEVRAANVPATEAAKLAEVEPPSRGVFWIIVAAFGLSLAVFVALGLRRKISARSQITSGAAPSEEPKDESRRTFCDCPQCGKHLKVKEELIGKRVKCPGCGHAVSVPQDEKKLKIDN